MGVQHLRNLHYDSHIGSCEQISVVDVLNLRHLLVGHRCPHSDAAIVDMVQLYHFQVRIVGCQSLRFHTRQISVVGGGRCELFVEEVDGIEIGSLWLFQFYFIRDRVVRIFCELQRDDFWHILDEVIESLIGIAQRR